MPRKFIRFKCGDFVFFSGTSTCLSIGLLSRRQLLTVQQNFIILVPGFVLRQNKNGNSFLALSEKNFFPRVFSNSPKFNNFASRLKTVSPLERVISSGAETHKQD